MSTSLTFKRLQVLAAIYTLRFPSLDNVIRQTGIPKPTLTRVLRSLREDCDVIIENLYEKNKKQFYYKIHDWGIYSAERVVKKVIMQGGIASKQHPDYREEYQDLVIEGGAAQVTPITIPGNIAQANKKQA